MPDNREYRYAMYSRPVWGALSLSQPYTIDHDQTDPAITENRKYHNNREAYSILVTSHPLTASELQNLEMVDIAAENQQQAHKAELIEYTNALDGLSENGTSAVIDLIRAGKYIKTKADVDKWAGKYMAQGTRSAQKKAEEAVKTAPAPAPTEFQADPNLINRDLAMRSHHGTSFDPEKRGEQEIAGFSQDVENVHADLMKSAKTDEERAIINEEMKKFQAGYAKRWDARIAAHSRIISPMITGPSNFPVRRNEKACSSYENRVAELNAWHEKAVAAIHKKLNKHRVEAGGGEYAIMKRKLAAAEKMQVIMKGCNKIIRSKKLSDDEKAARMKTEFNLADKTIREVLTPDYMNRIGFADYRLSNNNANIRRMKERLKAMAAMDAKPSSTITFSGGEIIDNSSMDRVQIYFDEKPDEAMRTKLRGSGWNWSPSNGVWQRKRTNAAMESAKEIIGVNHRPDDPTKAVVPAILAPAAKPSPEEPVTQITPIKLMTHGYGYSKTSSTMTAPAPDLPPALIAPPELTADVLGGTEGLTPTPTPKRKEPTAPKPSSPAAAWLESVASSSPSKTTREKARKVLTGTARLPRTPAHPPSMPAIFAPEPAAPKHKPKPTPAPDVPPILTAPPELAADMLGTGLMGLTPTAAPKRKPAARTTRKPKAKPAAKPAATKKTATAKPKAKPAATKKTAAKPKAKKTATAKPAATAKLTASQREYLAINGFVRVKRGGKYVRVTR